MKKFFCSVHFFGRFEVEKHNFTIMAPDVVSALVCAKEKPLWRIGHDEKFSFEAVKKSLAEDDVESFQEAAEFEFDYFELVNENAGYGSHEEFAVGVGASRQEAVEMRDRSIGEEESEFEEY